MDEEYMVAVALANTVRNIVEELLESDEENTEVLEKVENYYEITVPNFNDNQFKLHFRLSRETFEYLLFELMTINYGNAELTVGRPNMPFEKKLLICIWYLGNGESFRSVACRFGIGKFCCWSVTNEVVSTMLYLNQTRRIIAFPSINETVSVAQKFEQIDGFPGIVGVIDGCHIEIEKPHVYGNSYINRKGVSTILLQGICDSEKIFLDVYAGEPGSVHDQRLFTKSPIYHNMQEGLIQIPNDCHLIGDLAYKLSTKVIVGFKDNGHLSPQEIRFNQLLNRNRVVIENAYAHLKGRFRRLKKMETKRLDLIPQYIITACLFHNICIKRGDFLAIQEDPIEEENYEEGDEEEDEREYEVARLKRDNIMNLVLLRNNFYE